MTEPTDPASLAGYVLFISLWVTAIAAAAARIALFLTTDSIIEKPRARFTEHVDRRTLTRPLATLANCAWCASFWTTTGLCAADAAVHGPVTESLDVIDVNPVYGWGIIIAALSLGAGMLTRKTG